MSETKIANCRFWKVPFQFAICNLQFAILISLSVSVSLWFPTSLPAHPVPKDHHDRTIVVRLQPAGSDKVNVLVEYRLEVDELTVFLDDMKPYRDEVDRELFVKDRMKYYAEFARIYAPIFAGNLLAKVNGKEVNFSCVQRSQRLQDDDGKQLGHLRCDFAFLATVPASPTN